MNKTDDRSKLGHLSRPISHYERLGWRVPIPCGVCSADVYEHEDFCIRCASPQGFPNVRAAESVTERTALVARAKSGRLAALSNGASDELTRLNAIAANAPISFNRKLSQIFEWCSNEDKCFRPWIWHVKNGLRIIPDEFNLGRISFEHNVNPNYSDRINFGYLDIGNSDLSSYGPIKIRLLTNAVRHRTTFLETNAYYFCKNHNISGPAAVPPGHRSSWSDRGLLMEAKLGGKVRSGMNDADLEYLLLHADDVTGPGDFMEAHVYNPVHISAIDTVWAPTPLQADAPMWGYVRSILTSAGARIEMTP